jgi:hypothetical protein
MLLYWQPDALWLFLSRDIIGLPITTLTVLGEYDRDEPRKLCNRHITIA